MPLSLRKPDLLQLFPQHRRGIILVSVLETKKYFMAQKFENDMSPMQNSKISRTEKYTDANDRSTEMTDMEMCMKRLEQKGYDTQYRVEKNKLVSLTTG